MAARPRSLTTYLPQKNIGITVILALLIVILILGLLLRFEGFFSGNVLFLYDGARELLSVKRIATEGKLYLIGPPSGGLQGYYHGVLWLYLLLIPFLLGGGNPLFFTAFIIILSSLSILLVFFVLRKLAGDIAGLIAATIFSLAPYSLETSRYIWNPYAIVWFMPLYFYSLYAFVKHKSYALPVLALLTSLAYHFEAIYGITLFPLLLLLGILELLRHSFKKSLPILALSLLLFLIPLIPSLVFDLRHDFMITNALVKTVTTGGANFTHDTDAPPPALTTRFLARLTDLGSYSIHSVSPNKQLNILFAVLFLIGCVWYYRSAKKDERLFLILCLLFFIFPLLLFTSLKYQVWSYYWVGVPAFFTCLFAYIMGKSLHTLPSRWFLTAVLLILLVIAHNPLTHYLQHRNAYVAPGTNNLATQQKVVKDIYKEANGKPFSVYVHTPPVYDYIWRYHFWYEGTRRKTVLPTDAKQDLYFVILEPSPSDPNGTFLKKDKIKVTGKPIKTTRYRTSGGIVVETFIRGENEPDVDTTFLPPMP